MKHKRKLFPYIENFRQIIASRFNEFEQYYMVDSMLFEVVKISRVCKEQDVFFPDKGYCMNIKNIRLESAHGLFGKTE